MWWISRVLELPPRLLVRKAGAVAARLLHYLSGWCRDWIRFSYGALPVAEGMRCTPSSGGVFRDSFAVPEWLGEVTDHYLAHRFDLLGSGWSTVRYGMACRGLEGHVYRMSTGVNPDREGRWLRGRVNRANLAEAQRLWRLVDADYVPIDWQLDFKSGYRWSERTWYRGIPYGHLPGVDIKVPWELARMQHLPQMAIAHAVAQAQGNPVQAGRLMREFRNQALDFMATNPPRFGVNWRGTMDVAIRVANWLLAYDLFVAAGAMFDEAFACAFQRSIEDHGHHIVGNLEWYEDLRTNHYLADIVGLLFIARYLPRSPKNDAWLAFAVQELLREVETQFYEEGSNFEASVCYHRLSAEMVAYATAIVLGLDAESLTALRSYDHRQIHTRPGLAPSPLRHAGTPIVDTSGKLVLPQGYRKRLAGMAEFSMHVTKHDGSVIQVGDNDSGRFAKLSMAGEYLTVGEARRRYTNLDGYDELPANERYFLESQLDHRHLVSALNVFLKRVDLAGFAHVGIESRVLSTLAGENHGPQVGSTGETRSASGVETGAGDDKAWSELSIMPDQVPPQQRQTFEVVVDSEGVWAELALHAYPKFGLYVFRSRRVFLALRCGPVGQNGRGGHAHHDQLAITLSVDGCDWLNDPGTALYTSSLSTRNAYRSVRAHWAPRLAGDVEPGSFRYGAFRLDGDSHARCLYFGRNGFAGLHHGYGAPVHRLVRLTENGFAVVDWTTGSAELAETTPATITEPMALVVPFSPAYGWQLAIGG